MAIPDPAPAHLLLACPSSLSPWVASQMVRNLDSQSLSLPRPIPPHGIFFVFFLFLLSSLGPSPCLVNAN